MCFVLVCDDDVSCSGFYSSPSAVLVAHAPSVGACADASCSLVLYTLTQCDCAWAFIATTCIKKRRRREQEHVASSDRGQMGTPQSLSRAVVCPTALVRRYSSRRVGDADIGARSYAVWQCHLEPAGLWQDSGQCRKDP